MPTPAEVWQEFKPKLAAAREADRARVALSFLPVVIPLGRFEIAPLTIERLLWLEQIKSPFVVGAQPARCDVLAFLWIMSPDFRLGEKYGKRFVWNNCFIRWRVYAELIAAYMNEIAEMMGGNSKEGAVDVNWLPQMVDAFASQYHWTHDQIMQIPLQRVNILAHAMTARLSEKSNPSFSPSADAMRHEMLIAIRAAEAEAAKEKENGKK